MANHVPIFVQVTSGVPDSKHSKAAYPLEYTGVVGGIEMDERRRRHSHRHREAAGDRHLALNPQAFGEQLSQALRALQTSSSPEHANDLVPLAIQVFPPSQEPILADQCKSVLWIVLLGIPLAKLPSMGFWGIGQGKMSLELDQWNSLLEPQIGFYHFGRASQQNCTMVLP